MRIDLPPRKPPVESIIPMINVVFLLLIFFLLTAQIAPPTPFVLEPPVSKSDVPALDRDVLYLSATGEMAYNDARGEAVWSLIAERQENAPLEIRADASASGIKVAELLRRLSEISASGAQLVVNGR